MPTPSLWMTPNWEKRYAGRRWATTQWDLNKLEDWANKIAVYYEVKTVNVWGLMKTNVESCSWDGTIPNSSTGWGPAGWGAALLKRPWGSGQTASWAWTSSLPGSKGSRLCPGLHQQEYSQQTKRCDYSSLLGTCQATPGLFHPVLLSLCWKETLKNRRQPGRW